MLVSVVFYNTLSTARTGNALALDAFGSEVTVDSPARPASFAYRLWSRDAVGYDSSENGRGGPPGDILFEEIKYPSSYDDALLPDFSPLVIDQNQTSRDQIVYYVVEDGDTISGIASRFDVEPSTILWANNLSSVAYIKAGQRLDILPVDGVKYEVKKGDTIGALAKKFKASDINIIAYNHLPADGSLRIGDALIIPDGVMPAPPKPAPSPRALAEAQQRKTSQHITNKYFVFPTTGRISQGLHGYNGVDIANQCGTPIYASADGIVSVLRTTESRSKNGPSVYQGYGNHIKIEHMNGTLTLYAHLESIFVAEGQRVAQGDSIATMGGGFEYVDGRLVRMEGAGRSTGCHLHFEVRGAKNPFARGRR